MGKRDFSWREPKKSKKREEKIKPLPELVPQAEVEVIKKKKKASDEEVEE